MILSYTDLHKIVEDGVINALPENVNAASIDIRLGDWIMIEDERGGVVDLADKQSPSFRRYKLEKDGYILHPGDFILAQSVEVFNLPDNISAEYVLKSSMARSGLEHLTAGFCDSGWHGSVLTLELKNVTNHHSILIKPGMKIGQMKFYKHKKVPKEGSYATKGQYNGDRSVSSSKGLR